MSRREPEKPSGQEFCYICFLIMLGHSNTQTTLTKISDVAFRRIKKSWEDLLIKKKITMY